MTNNIVDGETDTFREVHEVDGGGVRFFGNNKLEHNLVKFVQRHTHFGTTHRMLKRAAGDFAGDSETLNLLSV